MRFFIIGANGLVGQHLCHFLVRHNHQVTALVRHQRRGKDLPEGVEVVVGNALAGGQWQETASNQEVLVNLVGKNIMGRWTKEIKNAIYATRIDSTRQAVRAIELAAEPKPCLVNANAVGFYPAFAEQIIDETAPAGEGFLAEVCKDWQNTALEAEQVGARVVVARFATVLAAQGGALPTMLPAFRLGLGGPIGSGRQGFPWIHIQDLVQAIVFAARTPELSGPVNMSAPHICTNKEFSKTLGQVLRRPAILPVPKHLLRLVFGEMADMLVQGPFVRPRRLEEAGFRFTYPELKAALRDLLER
ncbi:MAG: TIGR01777 family oxidoreductase [Thermodesulfobacteriota bacterium]